VLLMPAHTPPHKADLDDPGPEHRLRMCEALAAGAGAVRACALEVERGGASYTVDTLEAVHGGNPDAELTFIVGADVAATLQTWRDPRRVLELAAVAVAAREGTPRERVLDALASVRASAPPAHAGAQRGERELSFLNMPLIEISSSQVRGRAARGEPIGELVGPAVAAYIGEHGLYRTGGAR
jgi:nicotinate-nucleotide adenylyltransferase